MLYSDISELKAVLDIQSNNHGEDLKLNFFNEQVTGLIEEALGRPGQVSYKLRTQYYNGTNTQKLLLRSRPVFTDSLQVWHDETGWFGSTSGAFPSSKELVYGTDFCLQIDQDDGSSRCGILVRINGAWTKFISRQRGYLTPFVTPGYGSIKVTYYGGYTLDTLPENFRTAADLLVARFRNLFPLGMELSHESYEERVLGYINQHRNSLLGLIRPFILPYRNWVFGGGL